MRGQRGATLIELMVAAVVVLVALLGLVACLNEAAHANAVGHRRTVATQIRAALLDRLAVMPRDQMEILVTNAGGSSGSPPTSTGWLVDGCYSLDGQLLASNSYGAGAAAFACGSDARYRSWLKVEPGGNRTWLLRTFAERTDLGCAPGNRYTALYCVAGDLLVTD
jgi:Tfp pilus assembly protein PilV